MNTPSAVKPDVRNLRSDHPGRPYPFFGLTLIEFMIVLAVAGILVAMVIPQMQNALIRSRVAEGLAGAEEMKAMIAANAQKGMADLSTGVKVPPPTRLVKSMTVTNTSTGEIEVKYGQEAGGGSLLLVPHTGALSAPASIVAGKALPAGVPVQWACKASGSRLPIGGLASTLAEHAPDNCL
jgi:prepilin-type N-terminal cleavage/methylation domain-containing protein